MSSKDAEPEFTFSNRPVFRMIEGRLHQINEMVVLQGTPPDGLPRFTCTITRQAQFPFEQTAQKTIPLKSETFDEAFDDLVKRLPDETAEMAEAVEKQARRNRLAVPPHLLDQIKRKGKKIVAH